MSINESNDQNKGKSSGSIRRRNLRMLRQKLVGQERITKEDKSDAEVRLRFQRNLHALAEKKQCYDEVMLAKRMGWVTAKKKWLRRLWREGLLRSNSKTEPDLVALANSLGLADAGQFWAEDVKLRPSVGVADVLSILTQWNVEVANDFRGQLRSPHESGGTVRDYYEKKLQTHNPHHIAEAVYRHATKQEPPTSSQKHLMAEIDDDLKSLKAHLYEIIDERMEMIRRKIYGSILE